MDYNKTIFFYDICRLCLDEFGINKIFNDELTQDIFLCTGIKILSSDSLPQKICKKCMDIINSAKDLRILAKKNDKHLKSLFGDENILDNEDQTDATTSDIEENQQIQNIQKDKRRKSSKRLSSETSDCDSEDIPLIKLRRNLFESSSTVSSSTQKTNDTTNADKEKKRNCLASAKKITVDGEIKFLCQICDKKFDKYKKYYLHQRLHNKNIICPVDACGKKFATKGDLEKHLRTHTGEKPYQCEVCGKGFAQRGTLKAHRDTVHHNGKPSESILGD